MNALLQPLTFPKIPLSAIMGQTEFYKDVRLDKKLTVSFKIHETENKENGFL